MNNQITIYCNYDNKEFFESVLPNFKLKFKKLDHINLSNSSTENILFFCPKAVDTSFINRAVNEGFSGGEKKRNEILPYIFSSFSGEKSNPSEKIKYGKSSALKEHLLAGNRISFIEASIIFGIGNLWNQMRLIKKDGFIIKTAKVFSVPAICSANATLASLPD